MELTQTDGAYRKVLTATVSSILLEHGIDSAEKECLGTLTEMLQCCMFFALLYYKIKLSLLCNISVLYEIGYMSKNYCELSGRVEPVIGDVILGFVEMGMR